MKVGLTMCAALSGMLMGSTALTWTANATDNDDFYRPSQTEPAVATAGADIPEMTALTEREHFDCRTSTFPGDPRLADIPNTSLTFHQGGTKARSVLVTFVANWPIPTGSDLPQGSQSAGAVIFLTIDDQRVDVVSNNGGTLVHDGTADFSNGTHGFTFVTQPIAPGDHEAHMLWSNNFLNGTGTVCIFERSLVVQHR
jgi:hypothetical protein